MPPKPRIYLSGPLRDYFVEIINRPASLPARYKKRIHNELEEVTRLGFKREPWENEVHDHALGKDISLLLLLKKRHQRGQARSYGYLSTKQLEIGDTKTIYAAGAAVHPDVQDKNFFRMMLALGISLEGEKIRLAGERAEMIGASTQVPAVLEVLRKDWEMYPVHVVEREPTPLRVKERNQKLAEHSRQLAFALGASESDFNPRTCIRKNAYQQPLMGEEEEPRFKNEQLKTLYAALKAHELEGRAAIILSGFFQRTPLSVIFNPQATRKRGAVGKLYQILERHYPELFSTIANNLHEILPPVLAELLPQTPSRKRVIKNYGLASVLRHLEKRRKSVLINKSKLGPTLELHFKPRRLNLHALSSQVASRIRQRKGPISDAWQRMHELQGVAVPSAQTLLDRFEADKVIELGVLRNPKNAHFVRLTVLPDGRVRTSFLLNEAGKEFLEILKQSIVG